MKTFKILTAVVLFAGTVPFPANADFDYPKLPWYEKYFFPLGCWVTPYLECVPDSEWPVESERKGIEWSDWNARYAAINWDEYHNLGLDFAKLFSYYHPYKIGSRVSGTERTTYEKRFHNETGHELAGLVETNQIVLDNFKNLNTRVFMKAGDMYRINYDDDIEEFWLCFPRLCGDQGDGEITDLGDPPWGFPDCDTTDYYDQIYDHYDDQGNGTNPSNGPVYEKTIAYYEDYENLTAYDIIDEPRIYQILPCRAMVDYCHDHDVEAVMIKNMVDYTGMAWERLPDDVYNYYKWSVCHIGDEVFMGREYPFRHDIAPNAPAIYNGKTREPPPGAEEDGYTGTRLDHGFYGLEQHLKHGRETGLTHAIPFWHLPGVTSHFGPPSAIRIPTPRELNAETNMALTYGAAGILYYTLFKPEGFRVENDEVVRYFTHSDSLLDENGDLQPGTYSAGTHDITYQSLYNEVLDINTKLHSVRDTLQTTVSLDAFHSFDLDNELPRGLIYDYVGNRDRGTQDDYPPDYEDCVDFLDFGTFVCPYTGVRYLAVSDRFCNWPPATFPNPIEEDEVTVRHPGRIIFDVYDDDPQPDYFTYFKIDNLHYDNGASTFDVDLNNADGRIFKLDPRLNYNPGFEDDEHPTTPPADWTMGGESAYFTTTDEEARKGDWSCKAHTLTQDTHAWLDSEVTLDIDEDVFAGMKYRVSGYIKCSSGSTTHTEFQVKLEDTVPAVAETMPLNTGTGWVGPDGWVYTHADFEMPEPQYNPQRDTVWARIFLHGGDENSTIWFDEVRLEPLSRVFNCHFEWGGGDWWFGPVHGWGWSFSMQGVDYERYSAGRYGDYCMRVGTVGEVTRIRNDEKLYLGKGTNYAVTGWAKKDIDCPDAKVIVEFYTTKDVKFNVESYIVQPGNWQQFTIPIKAGEWGIPFVGDGPPAYVKIACKVGSHSTTKNAYFDNIELIETNLVSNGSFELAEEGPHWPDRWDYMGLMSPPDPGDPEWSAVYDATAKYDRRCWRVRTPPDSNIGYGSETFVLEPGTQYRLSGWMRNFDVDPYVITLDGCKLKINLYDSYGTNLGSYETGEVRTQEEWTYKYVDFTTPDGGSAECFARVTVVEEEDAYSSAADGIRVLPVSIQ
ncbi:MAG: hypothetical protein JSW52_09760 [Candidatus Coatesbacteria bacterium]|nr:MAG: hypothetical protein JSW52_09760 [Candidatus Coatesbacteria bacterium]